MTYTIDKKATCELGPSDLLRDVNFGWVAINLIDISIQIDKQIKIRIFFEIWSKIENQTLLVQTRETGR